MGRGTQRLSKVSMGSVVQLALHVDEAWTWQQHAPAPGRGGDVVPVGCYEQLRLAGSLPGPVARDQSLAWGLTACFHPRLNRAVVCKTSTLKLRHDGRMLTLCDKTSHLANHVIPFPFLSQRTFSPQRLIKIGPNALYCFWGYSVCLPAVRSWAVSSGLEHNLQLLS